MKSPLKIGGQAVIEGVMIKSQNYYAVSVRKKGKIISKAEKIGTYELSKGPELCCLLGPKHPATKSSAQQMQKELEKIDAEQLIKQSLERAEILQF